MHVEWDEESKSCLKEKCGDVKTKASKKKINDGDDLNSLNDLCIRLQKKLNYVQHINGL